MSSLELYKAILDGHLHIKTGAKRKAKTAVNRARKIIEADPKVVRTAIFEIDEITKKPSVGWLDHPNTEANYSVWHTFHYDRNSIPLHWVCLLCNHPDMVKLLFEKTNNELTHGILVQGQESAINYVSSLAVQTTKYLMTPLYFACKNEQSIDIDTFRFILDLYPKAAEICTFIKWLPLHHCVSSMQVEKVSLLLEVFPEGSSFSDEHGMNPLHIAAGNSQREKVPIIEKIMNVDPNVATTRYNSWLPIHYAMNFDDREVRDHLMDAFLLISRKSSYHGLFERADGFGFSGDEMLVDVDEYELVIPSWEKHTPWSVWMRWSMERNNHDQREGAINTLFERPIGEEYPTILHDAIGNIPLQDIQTLSTFIDHTLRNDDGETPLMAALKMARQQSSTCSSEQQWLSYYKPVILGLFQHLSRRHDAPDVDDFNNLNYFAVANMRNEQENRYLLHYVCEAGLPWMFVKEIAEVNIHALPESDGNVNSGLLPFMLMSEGLESNLSSAYGLLRARPDVIKILGFSSVLSSGATESSSPPSAQQQETRVVLRRSKRLRKG